MLYDDFEAFKNQNRLDEAIRPRSFIPRSFSEQWSEVFFRSNRSSGFLRQQHSITSRPNTTPFRIPTPPEGHTRE